MIKAYQITVADFEKNLRATPWYRIGRILYLQKELNYFREKLEKAIQEEEEGYGKQ